MAISSMDGLVAAFTGACQDIPIYHSLLTGTSSLFFGLDRWGTGSPWGTASAPTAYTVGADVPTDATHGFPDLNDPPAGQNLYLAGCTLQSSIFGSIGIYDRVWASAGFSGNTTTTQTVVGGAATIPAARCPITGKVWRSGWNGMAPPALPVLPPPSPTRTPQASPTGARSLHRPSQILRWGPCAGYPWRMVIPVCSAFSP